MVLSHSPRADSRLVVVTGANGFIGQALCAHFVANGRPHRRIVRALPEGAAAAADTVVLGDLASASEEGLAAALTVRLRWCTLRRGSTCRARPAGIRR
jgi:nucleoside-diphosphate-sugar epimerase